MRQMSLFCDTALDNLRYTEQSVTHSVRAGQKGIHHGCKAAHLGQMPVAGEGDSQPDHQECRTSG